MGVAVDDAGNAVAPEGRGHLVGIDVRDDVANLLLVLLAGGSCLLGECDTLGKRFAEKPLDPRWIAYLLPKGLVGVVVRAERVAVKEKGGNASHVHHAGIRQQLHAGLPAIVATQQEVPIAAHEADGNPTLGDTADAGGNLARQLVIQVIADPGFEQIAQDEQRLDLIRDVAQERQEQRRDRRTRGIQMQVGNEPASDDSCRRLCEKP